MHFAVTQLAQPDYFERFGVVEVMTFKLLGRGATGSALFRTNKFT